MGDAASGKVFLTLPETVMPAKAGIQDDCFRHLPWTPAFAVVTREGIES
jgi:hypothetical protein